MMLFEPKGIVELAVAVSERCQSQNNNIKRYANKKREFFSPQGSDWLWGPPVFRFNWSRGFFPVWGRG
jgi:hypothetical protein